MTLNVLAPTWKFKTLVDDTVNFGGDLAATGSSPLSWSSGAYSNERVFAILATDYLELDLTFDAKSNGHGISVGLSAFYPGLVQNSANWEAHWCWNDTQQLIAFEQSVARYTQAGVTLPMSCRIVWDAGTLKFYSNAGVDTLRYTSLRSVATLLDAMKTGLSAMVTFYGTSGKVHVTLKGGTSVTPEVGGTSTGRIGTQLMQASGILMPSLGIQLQRTLQIAVFPPSAHPRPTEGKIWPRRF